MRKKIDIILIIPPILLIFFGNSLAAQVNFTPIWVASTLCINNRCNLYAKIDVKHFVPLEERLYQENIPILWVYKNGVKIKEFTINDLDKNRLWMKRGEGKRSIIIMNALNSGEIANIKLKVDPLNIIKEYEYVVYYHGNRKVEEGNCERDNEKTWTVACGTGMVKVNCPRGMFFPGTLIRVSGKLYRYNYGLVHYTTLKRFSIVGVLNLVSEKGKSKVIGAKSISLLEDQNEKTFVIPGKIPSNTHSGRYTLLVKFNTYNELINLDSISCPSPIVVEPTVQETASEGRVKPLRPLLKAEKIAHPCMPDLKIEGIRVLSSCRVEIILKNAGAGLQDTVYTSNPVILKITDQQLFRTFTRFNLSQVDPSKKFKKSGSEVVVIWNIPKDQLPMDKNLKFLVDPNRKILESNERNNFLRKHIVCGKKLKNFRIIR